MATFETYRTARTPKRCDDYPRCDRGIQPGERYLRASATPRDMDVNPGDRWWTLNICREHMRPERHGPDWSNSLPEEPPSCRCGYNGTPEECKANA